MIFILSVALLTSCMATKPLQLNYRDYAAEREINSELSKEDLYIAARSWLVEVFDNSSDVIHFLDKDAGIIKGRYTVGYSIPAVITILIKDQHTKLRIAPRGIGSYYPPNTNPNGFDHPNIYPGPIEFQSLIKSHLDDYELFIKEYKKY